MFIFALKNMLRYKTRSLITLIVVAATAFTSLTAMGFTTGIIDLMISSFVKYQTAHIRIVTPAYLEKIRFRPVYENIPEVSAFAEKLKAYPEVEKVVPTFSMFGLASLGGGAAAYQSRGLALPFENNTYDFPKKLKEGSISKALIGTKFAQKMGAQAGGPLMIASTTVEGGLNAIKPDLGGFVQFNMKAMDNNMFFLDLPEAQRLLRAPDCAAEVFVYLKKESDTVPLAKKLQKDFPDLAVQSYYDQLGPIAAAIEIERNITWLITAFIMVLGSLAVVNSLIAGIYDRINEIGMLKAVGYTDSELSLMLVYEGALYGLAGGTIGFALGSLLLWYFGAYGLDLTSMLATAELPIEPVLYPVLGRGLYITGFLISVLVPALVALLPGKHIRKITPVEALRS